MSGRATLTMNRSRLASTIPAQAIARTWLGFVRLTATSTTSTADLRLTLCSPYDGEMQAERRWGCGRRYSSRHAASRRGRRVLRWNRDLRAIKSAFQRRDAGRDIAFPAVFQRHSGFQGPGIAVRVMAVI